MTLAPRDQTPFMEMEARDEQQILAAIEGQVVTEFIYKVEGKIGLSLTGVNHMCFKMGHIRVDPASARIEYDEREDEYTAYIVAVNSKYDLSAMGVSTQPRMMEIHEKDGQGRWVKNADGSWKMIVQRDRFAKTKAMSKAQRNSKRQVIPEAIIKAYLDYFMKLKEGQDAEAPSFEVLDLDQPPKKVNSEQVPSKEKPRAKVGPLPRRNTPETKGQRIDKNTITYNLAALDFDDQIVGVHEEDGKIIVEPTKILSEKDQYKIDSILSDFDAKWTPNVGFFGRWVIEK